MRNLRSVTVLSVSTAVFAGVASAMGIFYTSGGEPYLYTSIRGKEVEICGRGLYEHMSWEVAVQGIAHDYVTLLLGVPALLLSSFLLWRKSTLKSILFHAGVLKFFFLTYLLYLNMAMYNQLFLLYILITGFSFFALIITLVQVNLKSLKGNFLPGHLIGFIGGYLIFLSCAIGFLWLEIIISPLINGEIIPASVEHYTSLTAQGLDLAIFLPIAFLSGVLLLRENLSVY